MATTDIYSIVGRLHPTRKAIRFLGGDVDDGVQVDSLVAAIVAGNHTKGTITAWVMIPDTASDYTIFGAGDADAVEYMIFNISSGKLQFKVYDGGATRVNITTGSTLLQNHKWHHVALVQDGTKPRLYIDGVMITPTIVTGTELGQWFDDTDGIDGAHIGCADSLAGAAALSQEFKGYISDVKIWSGTADTCALTDAQIKADYNGVTNTTSLLAHYIWDGSYVNNHNIGTYNGTKVGDIIQCDANEFTSRLSFGCGIPVTADNIQVAINGSYGIATVIQQA